MKLGELTRANEMMRLNSANVQSHLDSNYQTVADLLGFFPKYRIVVNPNLLGVPEKRRSSHN